MALSLCARERIRADGPFSLPAFPLVLGFTCIVLVPITIYLYSFHTAWSWQYLINPAEVHALAVLPVMAAQGGMLIGGWYLGTRMIRSGSTLKPLYYSAGGGLAAVLLLVLILRKRLMVYGTYQEFAVGRTRGLMEVKLGYVLVVLVLGAGVATVFLVMELLRDSRRVRAK